MHLTAKDVHHQLCVWEHSLCVWQHGCDIRFNTDGTAHCLWTDAILLHDLGRLQITRASTIEINNDTQHWQVKDRKGKVRLIARSRSACPEWELENLQPE